MRKIFWEEEMKQDLSLIVHVGCEITARLVHTNDTRLFLISDEICKPWLKPVPIYDRNHPWAKASIGHLVGDEVAPDVRQAESYRFTIIQIRRTTSE